MSGIFGRRRSENHSTKLSLIPGEGYSSIPVNVIRGSRTLARNDSPGLPIGEERAQDLNQSGHDWEELNSIEFEFHNFNSMSRHVYNR